LTEYVVKLVKTQISPYNGIFYAVVTRSKENSRYWYSFNDVQAQTKFIETNNITLVISKSGIVLQREIKNGNVM